MILFLSTILILAGCSAPVATATQTATSQPPTQIPTATIEPTGTPVPPAPIPETSQLLYAEDFEDQVFDGWQTYSGNWNFVEEGSNYVLVASGLQDYPQAWSIVGEEWTDYAFESRIRIQGGTLFICVRSAHGENFYNTHIDSDYTEIVFSDFHDGSYANFGRGLFKIVESEWYLMRFEVQGAQLRFYINNELILSSERHSLSSGGIGYYMGGGSRIHIDDIRVWSLAD